MCLHGGATSYHAADGLWYDGCLCQCRQGNPAGPGSAPDRRIVAAAVEGQYVVAPDNGVVAPLLDRHAPTALVAVQHARFLLEASRHTFHCRLIYAPAAAAPATVARERLSQPPHTLRVCRAKRKPAHAMFLSLTPTPAARSARGNNTLFSRCTCTCIEASSSSRPQ